MKKFLYKISILSGLAAILSLAFIPGCSNETEPSLFTLVENSNPTATPVINAVTPSDAALAGVTKIQIDGENFSTVPGENYVYFNGAVGTVLEATSTHLVVTSPPTPADSVSMWISVLTAPSFSNKYAYKLKPAVSLAYEFKESQLPYALTTDKQGNLYFSMTDYNVGVGIQKVGADGELTQFAPKGGETFFNSIKMGPNNTIYAARKVKAIFYITEGQKSSTYVTYSQGIGSISDLDFDQNGNMWAGGEGNGNIYSITPEKSVTSFPFAPDVVSIRIYDGYVYVAGKTDTEQSVWRMKINAVDNLGAEEKYFAFSDNFTDPTTVMGPITFSQDGNMYIGTNLSDAIVVVHPDKSYESLYPGQVMPNAISFDWNSNFLYYTREATDSTAQTIVKVDMEKNGAPYYGRQ